MPRPPRFNLADMPQHIVHRGNNRATTFFHDADYRYYLECLKTAAERFDCAVHAYVLMTNHVHLLITPRAGHALPKLMQSLGRRYVRYVNDSYRRTGTLWEGRYRASLVDSERYLLACYRYIELNPVRASIVKDPADYPWSSYAHHALGKEDELIVDHAVYQALGATPAERRAAYQALAGLSLDAQSHGAIRDALNQCRALGGARFRREIGALLGRAVGPARRGRPRRNDRAAAAGGRQ